MNDLTAENARRAVEHAIRMGSRDLMFLCSPQMEPMVFREVILTMMEINKMLWTGSEVRIIINRGIMTWVHIFF